MFNLFKKKPKPYRVAFLNGTTETANRFENLSDAEKHYHVISKNNCNKHVSLDKLKEGSVNDWETIKTPKEKYKFGGDIDVYYQGEYYAWVGEHGNLGNYSSNFSAEYNEAKKFFSKEKKDGKLSEYGYIGVSGSGDDFAIVYITREYIDKINTGDAFSDEIAYKNWKAAAEKCLETGKPQKGNYSKVFGKGGEVNSEDVQDLANGYKEAILFTGNDDEDESLDRNYTISDFNKKSNDIIMRMARQYVIDNYEAIEESGLDYEQVGRDVWFTQSGSGVGFHDRDISKELADKLAKGAKKFGDLSHHVFAQDGEVYIEGMKFEAGGEIYESGFDFFNTLFLF